MIGPATGSRLQFALTTIVHIISLVGIVAGLMYPTIDRAGGLTVETTIDSTLPVNLMSIGAAVLLPVIFVYFAVLSSAFSGPIEVGESY